LYGGGFRIAPRFHGLYNSSRVGTGRVLGLTKN
jgi:hypothetical protein